MSKRIERISGELKKEISKVLLNDIKDPRLTAMPGVIAVKVSDDLSYADVFVSLYGDEQDKKDSMEAIKSATGYIRSKVSGRMSLRHMPELRFICDDFIAQGFKINRILDSLKKEQNDGTE